MKICSKCGLEKPLKEFERRRDSKDGYRQYCRNCKNIAQNDRNNIRKSLNSSYFWKSRCDSFNSKTARNGIASNIISNSIPISYVELENLYNANKFCHYCNIELMKEDITFDHKIPLSKNGSHTISNVAICCKDCNNLKWDKTEEEFFNFLQKYINRFC